MSSASYSVPSDHDAVPSPARRVLGLCILVAVLAGGPYALYRLAGAPHLPPSLPSVATIQSILLGSAVPFDALAYVLSTAAWIVWFWIVASVVFRVFVVVADTVTAGTAWVRSLRTLSDRLTLPVVRRLVDGTVVALTVVQLVGRTVPTASAAPAPVVPVIAASQAGTREAIAAPNRHVTELRAVLYTVHEGDTLWSIAERFYGDGNQFVRIINANADRLMAPGQVFPRTGVIQPGWILTIPDVASPAPVEAAPAPPQQTAYDVQEGDTLRSIATRFYGDEMRWPAIFQTNAGSARLPDGRVLSDPDLIWPGLHVTIPGVAPVVSPAPTVAPPVTPPPVTAPARTAQQGQPAASPESTSATTVVTSPTSGPEHGTSVPTVTPAITALPTRDRQEDAVATPPEPFAILQMPSVQGTPMVAPTPIATAPIHMHNTFDTERLLPAGLAALAAGGGVILLARRRARLHPDALSPDGVGAIPTEDGWADPSYARTFAHRLDGGAEPALLVAEQVLYCLQDAGIDDVNLISMREGRHTMELTLDADLARQEQVLLAAPDLAERLGAIGTATRTPDHDLSLELSNLALLRLATPPSESVLAPVPLLALGVLPQGDAFHVNWARLGHVLIASMPGGGADIVLTSMLAALAARCHPDHLRIFTVVARDTLPQPLLDMPHQCDHVIDPAQGATVRTLLDELQAEIERRMHGPLRDGTAHRSDRPDIVLAIGELDSLPRDHEALELLGLHGRSHGMHIVAATTRAETLDDTALRVFDTRLVLRMQDEEHSVRLLGRPDASDLESGGDLFVRRAGREPVRLRGFRIEPAHLDRMVDLMHRAYATARDDERIDEGPAPDPAPGIDADSDMAAATPSPDAPVPPEVLSVPSVPAGDATERPSAPAAEIDQEVPSNGHMAHSIREVYSLPTPLPISEPVDEQPHRVRARIEVRCFGKLEVLGDGRPLAPQGHHLPWELLIYLALHPTAGVPKRDLLRLLWPNTDADQAGPRLRVAMVRLREVLRAQLPDLSGDIVRGERDGTCHLDADLVWSDAQQFLALSQQVRRSDGDRLVPLLEEARSLYRGELFTEPYYGWMDRRTRGMTLRERFREDFAAITNQLAQHYQAQKKWESAVTLYEELLHAHPALQEVARQLYHCYAQLGDRAALLRTHERLVASLEQLRRTALPGQSPPGSYALERATVHVYDEAIARFTPVEADRATA